MIGLIGIAVQPVGVGGRILGVGRSGVGRAGDDLAVARQRLAVEGGDLLRRVGGFHFDQGHFETGGAAPQAHVQGRGVVVGVLVAVRAGVEGQADIFGVGVFAQVEAGADVAVVGFLVGLGLVLGAGRRG